MRSDCAPVPRMIRCSVKDLASCFYACRLPLEEEPGALCNRSQSMTSDIQSMAPDLKTGSGCPNGNVKKVDRGESDHHRSLNKSLQSIKYSKGEEGRSPAEPQFAEEDYIVFRFRENGEIHMISDGQSSHAHSRHTNAAVNAVSAPFMPITRKFHYSEGIELIWDKMRGVMVSPDNNDDNNIILTNGKGILISDMNEDDQEKTSVNRTGITNEVKDDPNLHHHHHHHHHLLHLHHPVESCGSNLSDNSSTDSFTFPELGVEWIGSPVHLPKAAEDQYKGTSCMDLHYCCRF